LHHSRRPKQTFVKYASLVYEPGATQLSFFFNSGPKKPLSLSPDVKCDQRSHKKNDASNDGINLKKIIQQSSHNNFSDVTWFDGVCMGLIMGSQNVICLDYGSNISASTHI
jgi:hypothetical protein